MKERSPAEGQTLRDKIIGMGDRSIRKSYYPQLQQQLEELEKSRHYLAESEARYRSLIANINDVIFSLDTRGQITYVSPVIRNMGGLEPEQLLGQPFTRFVHPEDLRVFQTGLDGALAGGLEPIEFRFIGNDGATRYVRVSIRAATEDGRVTGVTGTMSDVTEKKRAEDALRDSEKRYRRIVDTAGEGILALDRDGTTTFVNARMANLLGYSPAEMLGRPITEFLFEEDMLDHQLKIERRRQGLPDHYERRVRRKDGQTVWMLASATPILDEQGAYQGSFAMFTDITENKRAEDALRDSEKRYRRIVDTAGEGILVHDPDGLTTFVNARMPNLLGYSAAEMLGRPLTGFMFEEDIPDHQLRIEHRRRGLPEHYARRFRRKDGQTVWTLTSVTPILDEQGTYQGSFAMFTDVTEQKRAEDALRDSEKRYRRIVDTAYEGVWEIDPDDLTTFVNARMADMLGYSVEEMLGRTAASFMVEEEVSDHRTRIGTNRRGLAEQYERRFHRKDGETVWTLISATPIFDEQGQYQGAFAMFTDISNRKRAEEARSRIGGYLAEAQRLTHTGSWANDATLQPVYWSEEEYRIFGFDPQKGLPAREQPLERMHPEDRDKVLQAFDKVIHGADAEAEYRIVLPDGTVKFLYGVGHPVFNADGELVEVVGTTADITERKRSEEQLRRSADEIRKLYDEAPCGYHTTTRDGVFVRMNATELRWLGYEQDEVMGKLNIAAVLTPSSLATYRDKLSSPDERLELRGLELEMVRKDRSTMPVLLNLVSSRGENGETLLSANVFDITSRKKLEAQFHQSQKMEAIGRLAGGVAHDFNNLLTVITGYCTLAMQRLTIGDPLLDDIERIQAAGARATELTQQLLAFSRKQVAQPALVNLNILVRSAERMLGRVIGENIELACSLEPALGTVRADPGQIHQILMNLAVNARDAMPSGGKILLKTANEEVGQQYASDRWTLEPGPYVVLSVCDTGVGMTEEVKNHVFEPFFTTKEAGKGTGLGLATVFGIVQQSGGHISFYSELGQGTTFRIYLPRVLEPKDEELRPKRAEQSPGGSETILVVEDQNDVRALTCAMLRNLGYRVLEAADGVEALLVCKSQRDPIHLMLTDVVMPHMNGPDLVARLRTLRPEVKSLYMSGYAADFGLSGQPIEGTAGFLQKPFTFHELACKVRDVLGRGGKPEQAPDGSAAAREEK